MRKKAITYMDELLLDKDFKARFDEEYQRLVISEKIAKMRKEANLTQDALAKRIHTTKSAISRYESGAYRGYTVSLLSKIAIACGAKMKIVFQRS
jgi:DNA-binding XRE family transcriptional regulator